MGVNRAAGGPARQRKRKRPTCSELTAERRIRQNLRMETLLRKVDSQLAQLPVPVALVTPRGDRIGAASAAVTVAFKDWSCLATLAAGQIGRLAEDYVENREQ